MNKIKIMFEVEVQSTVVTKEQIDRQMLYRMSNHLAPFKDVLAWYIHMGCYEAKFTKVEVK